MDAYDDPGLVDTSSPNFSSSDLAEFDQAFGLPDPPSFTKLSQFGSNTDLPGTDPAGAGNGDGNWEYEEAMDVEWAHAIAPAANIILVEANSDSFDDLYNAIDVAADYPGVSTVSLSWGSPEFAGETNWDDFFETPSGHQGVTFVAASGDGGAPGIDPAFSPNVVAAGGTSLTLNSDGSYDYEIGWFDSGGGVSQYEPEPAYQEGVQSTGYRTIPDVSFVSDRSPGVAVYDSYDNTGGGPWVSMGGTSLAAPSWAALIAIADQGRVAMGGTTLDGPSQTLPALYSLPSADFHDITTGYNGYYTAPGYDYVTGLGTPVANLLVPDLASYGMSDQLVVTAQPASSLSAGSSFGLTVAVESPGGQIMTGATGTVTLSLANNPDGAALDGTLTATLENGVATFSGLSIDDAGTGYSLLVTADGFNSVTSTAFDVVPASPAQLVIGDQPPSNITAGTGFGLTVDVEDAFGNLETSYDGSVTVALGTNPAGGSLGGTLTTTAIDGVAAFSGLTLDQAVSGYTIQATASGLSSATSQALDVTPSTGTQLVVSSEPAQSVMAGSGFGLAVLVEDAFGNIEAGYDGEVTVALAGGPGGASLVGTLTVPVTDGVADFSDLTLDEAGSGYTLRATSSGLTAANTTAFAVTPAAPAQLAITQEPQASVAAGAGFGLEVSVEDEYGNAETSYGGALTVALTSGSGLNGSLTVSAVDGMADFSGLTLDEAGSGYGLTVSGSDLASATTTDFTVTPAAPAQLVITSQPASTITAGTMFGLAVAVEDAFGNAEPDYSGNVAIVLSSGTGLSGTLAIPAIGGVADFSGLTLDRAGAGYTLAASGAGLSGASTTTILVTPSTASRLVTVTQPPASLAAGQAFGFTIAAEDAFGNAVTGFNGSVTASMANDPGGAPLSGPLTVTASNGLASFSGLTIDEAGAGYTLGATAGNLSSAITGPVGVSPATATQLVVTAEPPSIVTAGTGFGVSVAAEDAFGNVVTSFQGNVAATLSGGVFAGALGGETAATALNGVAQFSGLTLTEATYGDRLQLTSVGLSSATTNAITVDAGPPSRWVFISQPPVKVAPRQIIRIIAAIEDAYGNVVLEENGSASLSLAGGPRDATLHGSQTVPVNAGVAVFDGWMSNTPGTYSLSGDGDGLAPTTSNIFKVTHPSPGQSVFSEAFRRGRIRVPASRGHSHRGR